MEVKLSKPQSEIFLSNSRFKVAACGRRMGKTYISAYIMIQEACIPDSRIWYVTTSYRAAKSIIWDMLKTILFPTGYIDKVNEADLTLKLVNGSMITLRGGDNPDALRGVSLDLAVIDECSYVSQRVWTEALRPTLSDTGGGALFISSPSGRDWFYDLWKKGQKGPDHEEGWESWQFTTLQGGNVPKEEIEAAKRDLDAKTFDQEYNATFVQFSGLVYYGFDKEDSIRDYSYQKGRTVYIGIDFNVDPMSAVVAQKDNENLYVFDEIVIYSSNTDEMADEIRSRYPIDSCILYPDPASQQRKTSAGGKTDFTILQNYGFRVRSRTHHPYIRDRINAVNSRLQAGDGGRHLFFSPKCRKTIESVEKISYKEGTSIVDKTKGLDHLCFAGGQLVETERGIQKISKIDPKGMIRTINGKWVDYIHARSTGMSEIMILDLESGGTIECTRDHRILTVHGFTEAENLRVGEMIPSFNKNYKPPKPSEREIREDIDDLYEDFPVFVKNHLCKDRVLRKRMKKEPVEVYCLFVPRWHCFEIITKPPAFKGSTEYSNAIVSNCDALGYMVEYLHPVKRTGSAVSSMRLSGL